ncbi:HVA22-like protein k [Mangifera indica]|uniref:HVA22-like protein k n=1 Tax=Mangifera indica TaxID=29780 RepID=UPI001CFAD355|nr:HVA22-like protein k [Mangifera indica]
MDISRGVGLGLLLHPICSNIVVRTACCGVSTVLPAYSTFKAIENDNHHEQRRWLLYWTVYGSFRAAEVLTDKILTWFPLYYHVKFAFLVWLQLPSANGARHMYMSHLRPLLLRHQARLDQIVNFLYREMSNFIAHQPQFRVVRSIFMEIGTLVNQTVKDVIRPIPRQGNHAIEGPTAQIPDPHPDQGIEHPTVQILDPQLNHED